MTRASTTKHSLVTWCGREARRSTHTSAEIWTAGSTRSARTRLTRSLSGSGGPSAARNSAKFRSDGVAVWLFAVGQSGRGAPGEVPVLVLGQLPAGELFELVVGAAQPAEVARTGAAAAVVGGGVVLVAAGGRLAADRVAAGAVAGVQPAPEPAGHPVAGHFQGVH